MALLPAATGLNSRHKVLGELPTYLRLIIAIVRIGTPVNIRKRVVRIAYNQVSRGLCGSDYRMRGGMRILGYLLNRPKIPGAPDKQIALVTQFAGTIRDNGSELSQQPGNTLLSYERKHHWAWFIPVTEELTSVGVVFAPNISSRPAYQRKR